MSDMPVVEPGQVIAGKYQVEGILGRGAMGLVVAARHLALGRKVALKIMLGGPENTSAERSARFEREAKATAKLRSEHAGKVWDVGRLATGEPYIEIDFYEGKDLAQLLQARGALTVEEAVTYVLQAAEALAEAHQHGIVHRDVKPANLFLTTDAVGAPTIKVLDFGVSKMRDDDARLTQTGTSLGSPLYMAPELMRSAKGADGRADIWALGVVLYELLTEATPFTGETIMDLSARVLRDAPTPITTYRRDIPPGLAQVIMHCFEKEPSRRWESVAAFAAALAPYAPENMKPYVARIAATQNLDVVAARPTDVLPAEPKAVLGGATWRAPASPLAVEVAAGKHSTVGSGPHRIVAVLGLVAVVAVVGSVAAAIGWRGRSSSASSAPRATASAAPSDMEVPAVPSPVVTVALPTADAVASPPSFVTSSPTAAAPRSVVGAPARSPSTRVSVPAQQVAPGGLYDRGTRR